MKRFFLLDKIADGSYISTTALPYIFTEKGRYYSNYEQHGSWIAVLDEYPVSKGHVVLYNTGATNLFELEEEELSDLICLLRAVKSSLVELYGADGFNYGINEGAAAGQTVGILHVHVIPRYKGDVVDPTGGVRGVIPEKQNWRDDVWNFKWPAKEKGPQDSGDLKFPDVSSMEIVDLRKDATLQGKHSQEIFFKNKEFFPSSALQYLTDEQRKDEIKEIEAVIENGEMDWHITTRGGEKFIIKNVIIEDINWGESVENDCISFGTPLEIEYDQLIDLSNDTSALISLIDKRVLQPLFVNGPWSIEELMKRVPFELSAVKDSLRYMTDLGLVRCNHDGKFSITKAGVKKWQDISG